MWLTVDVRDIWDRTVEDALGLIHLSGCSIRKSISSLLLAEGEYCGATGCHVGRFLRADLMVEISIQVRL